MTRYKVLMAFFLIGMLLTGGFLLYYAKGYLDDRKDADNIREIAYGQNTDVGSSIEDDTGDASDAEIIIDFAALKEKNSDTVGWLVACGGVIDGPVVQTTDNEFYLDHRFDKSYGSVGCFFADAMLPAACESSLTVIYGHNRKDGSMFHSLLSYKDEAYFSKYPTFTIITEDKTITYQIFAAFFADNEIIYGDNFEKIVFDSDGKNADLSVLIQEAKEKSLYECMKTIPAGNVVILSTCEYSGDDNRMVVYGISTE